MVFAPVLGAIYLAAVVVKVHLAAFASEGVRALLLCTAAPPAAIIVALPSPTWLVYCALGVALGSCAFSIGMLYNAIELPSNVEDTLTPEAVVVASALLSAGLIVLYDQWYCLGAVAGVALFVLMHAYRELRRSFGYAMVNLKTH